MRKHLYRIVCMLTLTSVVALSSCWLLDEPFGDGDGATEMDTCTLIDPGETEPVETDMTPPVPDSESETPSTAEPELGTLPTAEPDTETYADTLPDTDPADGDPDQGLSDGDRAIRTVADAALRAAYEVPAWEHFAIEIDIGAAGNTYVSYRLMIQGYRTDESYRVTIAANGEVTAVMGSSVAEYACYLEGATAEAVRAAEERLGGGKSGAYLSIDREGYLCLCREDIVYFTPTPETDENGEVVEDAPLSGCGIDHDHIFYRERICPKP